MWVALVAMACNLGASGRPPTIVPRASATPIPTIGYATLAPEDLPDAVATVPPPQPDVTMLNLLNQVQSDRLMAHVSALVNMGTRHVNSSYNTPGRGIGAARDYINGQFSNIREQNPNFAIIEHTFPVNFGETASQASNIVGVLPGREVGAGVVVLGAHYDSISTEAWESGTVNAPGANDNASGMAALIEIARVLSAQPEAPRATVMFIAFSAEEIGREGSQAFVEDYILPNGINPDAMLNMDIIGSGNGPNGEIADRQIRVFSQGPNESASRQLARAANLIVFNHVPDMEVIVQDATDREGRYGDHMSFSDVGFPAIRFIEVVEDRERHHTTRDNLDDIQAPYLTRSTRTILAVTMAYSEGPRPPRNVVLRDNGTGLRTLVWEPSPSQGANSYVVALRRPGSLIYDQFFETPDTTVSWEGFIPTNFAGVAVAARDANGLLGPLSTEYFITN